MMPPELPTKASRRQLRKTLLRMRLEVHRQELRHEALVLLQPLRQARYLGSHWREELRNSSAPFWVAGAALLLATLGVPRGNWRRWLRIALIAFPLLRRRPARNRPDRPASTRAQDSSGDDPA